ncbi:MAG: 4'-phosphopantetheinyl transferase superfamily protein [Clostridium sp.]|nr:4'-phosphopantetheinyl transferase superfamily protein [Prevotella sp.]MCM1428395.1 4'-phosphopantetheinyl transferase superfamily protein [Clostridium sp.]MCM1474867.1 4'-phosphopantetheinyl transferase superfamily protein [Muribaculaceae bacterium]
METEFIYWRHPTAPGIKVEEISGAENKSGRLWIEMARQIYCENGKDNYRQIGHFRNGAPFIDGEDSRISITHTDHLLAVATLPRTPEADLREFSPRTAIGIDAERADREKVIKLRERFLNENELKMIDAESIEQNVLAWTIKEAAYKAALCEGLNFRRDICIERMPKINDAIIGEQADGFGRVVVTRTPLEVKSYTFDIFTWRSDECIVTLAYSPQCAKFTKGANV